MSSSQEAFVVVCDNHLAEMAGAYPSPSDVYLGTPRRTIETHQKQVEALRSVITGRQFDAVDSIARGWLLGLADELDPKGAIDA